MKRLAVIFLALFALSAQTSTGWVTLFDGKSLNNFNQIGTANWTVVDGVVQANTGNGYLVSKESYTDFEIKVEFWTSGGGNSGVYMRCMDGRRLPIRPATKQTSSTSVPISLVARAEFPITPSQSRSSTRKASGTPTRLRCAVRTS